MAKVLNFPGDYSGDLFTLPDGNPRLWWAEETFWQEREYITTITRTVEDMALLNIWLEARALQRVDSYRYVLSEVEEMALRYELRCLRENKHYSALMRHEWIAEHMGRDFAPKQVKSILLEVTDILRRAEMARVLDILEQAEKRRTSYFKGIVVEVLREKTRWVAKAA